MDNWLGSWMNHPTYIRASKRANMNNDNKKTKFMINIKGDEMTL
jgi:hypothetical protein